MRMSASRLSSVRVPAWNCHEMGWTTGVSGLSLKDWRACYAEHNRDEQVLPHQELYGYALQVQQNPCSDPASAWKRAAEDLNMMMIKTAAWSLLTEPKPKMSTTVVMQIHPIRCLLMKRIQKQFSYRSDLQYSQQARDIQKHGRERAQD